MSTSNTISTLIIASQQVIIYLGIPILVAGVLGGLLNVIVFLSLRTFRESSCAFYFTVMSFVNIGQLLTSLFSRIMTVGFNIDWTQTSLFYCKFRNILFHLCSLMSFTCMCLATIDQFFSTCSRPRWQQYCNIKLAYRLVLAFFVVWILHEIPPLLYLNLITSSMLGHMICVSTSFIYFEYVIYVYFPFLTGILPIFITVLFGSLAYRNVQQIAYRTVPLVRRELDKQLTRMVLVQVVYMFVVTAPFIIIFILSVSPTISQDPLFTARLQFASDLTSLFYYLYYASPFYIYLCVSKRFRQQLIYVLYEIHLKYWRRRGLAVNQVLPQL